MPMMMPSTVNAMRSGLANIPASASSSRSRDEAHRPRPAFADRAIGEPAVDHVDATRGAGGDGLVVRDDDQRQAVPVQFGEEAENRRRGLGIEVAGRLVAEQEARRAEQRPRNGDPLPLAAGKAGRQETGAVREADALDGGHRAVAPAAVGAVAVYLRQHDVFEDGPVGQQMERLEDEPDALAAQAGPLLVRELGRFDAVEQVAAAGRTIEAAEDVEKGRFPRAGRPGDRQPFATIHRQVDIDQRMHGGLGAVLPADLLELDDPVRCVERNRQRHELLRAHGVSRLFWLSYPTSTFCPATSLPSTGTTST
jgi:hypothetical protein